jgi:hypothetical protein
VLRVLTGRDWRLSEIEQLIAERQLIVSDSEPPRVFKSSLEALMRRMAFPPQDRSPVEDSEDLARAMLISELLGKGYRESSRP